MADKDINYFNVPDGTSLLEGLIVSPDNPGQYDDLLKVSGKQNLVIRDFEVRGVGIEDGIDCNRLCENVLFENGKVDSGKDLAFTIKGGCRNIHLKNILITRPGNHCEIELGNHSDQSWNKTTGVILENVRRADGKPVRVAWGRADKPKVIGGNVKFCWGWTVLLHFYVYLKHWLPFIP